MLADDITAETFVRAWTASGEIRMPTVKSYLFSIAKNLCLDAFREKARRVGLEEVELLPDPRTGLEDELEFRSDLKAVLAGLMKLDQTDRAALLLRVQEEMSYDEIAVVLRISPSSARVKVHRARLKLMQTRNARQESRV